ncbi:MAG: hypothetical protein HKN62_00410, partial [Phycisphaerales bacterium]|nr:hypothetical protein [Phycisphaerales bacterium]
GMAWRRPLAAGVTLVRPLLWATRADCEAYCEACGVSWRNDSSNDRSQRGRLRESVTGPLASMWPSAATRAAVASEALEAAAWAMERVLEQTFGPASRRVWPRDALLDLPPGLVGAGLRRAATDADPAVTRTLGHRQVNAVVTAIRAQDQVPRCFHWPRNMHVEVDTRAVELHTA